MSTGEWCSVVNWYLILVLTGQQYVSERLNMGHLNEELDLITCCHRAPLRILEANFWRGARHIQMERFKILKPILSCRKADI